VYNISAETFVPLPCGKNKELYTNIIPVNHTNLFWSPYNRYTAPDTTYKQAMNGGAYLKTTFSGTVFGLMIDISKLGDIAADTLELNAYFDGSDTPITKKFSAVYDGQLIFADTLSTGNHSVIMYLSKIATS
jgi:hypothetical protein